VALSPNIRITIEHLQGHDPRQPLTAAERALQASGTIGALRPAKPVRPRRGVGFPPSQALDKPGHPAGAHTLPYRPGTKPRVRTLPYHPKPGQKPPIQKM